MERGWFKFWRKTFDGWLARDHIAFVFFMWCVSKAAWEDKKVPVGNRIIELKRGQFLYGRKSAADFLGLSEKQVRRCLTMLEKMQNICVQRANKFSIITVMNYDTYQCCDTDKGPATDPATDPATGHKEELKELEEVKNKTKGEGGQMRDKDNQLFGIELFPAEWQENERFVSTWKDWVAHRRESGAPLHRLKTGSKLMVNSLVPMGMDTAIATMQRSMENGWRGLFPENGKGKGRQTSTAHYDNLPWAE